MGNRVEDKTEKEEYDVIFAQLPHFWQMELEKEEGRRSERNFWCRVTKMGDMSRADFESAVREACGFQLKSIKRADGGFLVCCRTDGDRDKLLGLNGGKFLDQPLKVTRTNVYLTGEEVFKFVTGKLAVQEEVEARRKAVLRGSKSSVVINDRPLRIQGISRENSFEEEALTMPKSPKESANRGKATSTPPLPSSSNQPIVNRGPPLRLPN